MKRSSLNVVLNDTSFELALESIIANLLYVSYTSVPSWRETKILVKSGKWSFSEGNWCGFLTKLEVKD